MQPLPSALSIALSLPLVLAACNAHADETTAPGTPPPPPIVTVAEVHASPYVEEVELTGRLGAVDMVEVRPRISGHIVDVKFQAGQIVEKDQVLFVIDPRWQQAELDRRKAELASAESRAKTAGSENERALKLLDTKAISTEESEGRAARLLEAQATLAEARAAVQTASLDLEYTQVRAPIRGRVSRALVTPGNFVSGVAGTNTVLTTIVSIDPIYAYADLDEATFLRFEKLVRGRKDPVTIDLALADEQGFPRHGVLESLDNAVDPRTGTMVLRARVPNEDQRLVPGLFVRMRVPLSASMPTLFVDERAVGTQQNQKYVMVVDAQNVAQFRTVKLGPLVESRRVIREGLQEGERVIVNGLQRARPGTPVTPQTVDAAAAQPSASAGGEQAHDTAAEAPAKKP